MIVECKYCKGVGTIASPFIDHPPMDCIHCEGAGLFDDPHGKLPTSTPVKPTFIQWVNSHGSSDWVTFVVMATGVITAIAIIVILYLYAEWWFVGGGAVLALFAALLRAYEQYLKEV